MRRTQAALFLAAALAFSAADLPAEEAESFFQTAKLSPPRPEDDTAFGRAVALDGDTLVITRASTFQTSGPGSAYVFRRDDYGPSDWELVRRVTSADPPDVGSDRFGVAADADGDTLVVGAHFATGAERSTGAVYVFERNAGGEDYWGQVAKVIASDGEEGDWFGYAVAIDGDTLTVGAPDDSDPGAPFAGSVYVFERDLGGSGAWGQSKKIGPFTENSHDFFGLDVALDGDTLTIGAHRTDELGSDTGSVYVLGRDADGPGAWGLVTQLTAADATDRAYFGKAVDIRGERIAVGAVGDASNTGAIYLFERDDRGIWYEVAKRVASDGVGGSDFGANVALSGDLLIVGNPEDRAAEIDAGSIYAFRRDHPAPGAWGQLARMTAADPQWRANLGRSIATDGSLIVAGATGVEDRSGNDGHGAAYLFESAVVDPVLTALGRCPGELELTASGATPLGAAELWYSRADGSTTLDSGPCTGRTLPLANAAPLRSDYADDTGGRSLIRRTHEEQCDIRLLFLDLTTCAASTVVAMPQP